MKKYLFALIAILSVTAMQAQMLVNDANVEKRAVTGFHGIEVSTGITLILTAGTAEEVAVSASKTEFRDRIITSVENGILKIRYENKLKSIDNRKEKKELRAYVSYINLDRLDANTGAEVEIEGALKANLLAMNVNTGAIVKGKIDIKQLEIDQTTGSIVTLTGEATSVKADGTTGSIFKGTDLRSDNCQASTTTGAGIYITVDKELSVKANTGGFVKYKGNAGVREIKTHTGGSVSRI
jgi:hypothetical protein